MGSIRLETVTDYAKHGYDLEVSCRVCGHKVVLTPQHFFARGELGPVHKIEKRLRCDACGGRHAVISSTSFGPSGGVTKRIRDWRERG